MNENLNLVEILKDCPKGTKLYLTLWGEVKLKKVENDTYPIGVENSRGDRFWLTQDGKYIFGSDGECVLFPSKDQRDWSKFNPKKEELDPPCRFKVSDWVVFVTSENIYQVEKIENYEYTLRHIFGSSLCIPFSNEELIREWTIQDAKDGDVLAAHECYVIFKEIDGLNIKCYCTYHYLGLNPSFYRDTLQNKDAFLPATKEQRDAMMKAINDTGYEWDSEKKELKKKVK